MLVVSAINSHVVDSMKGIQSACSNAYLRPISYFSLFFTLAVAVIALCTSSWYSVKDETGVTFIGLWNICTGKSDIGHCHFLPEESESQQYRINEEHLTAVRALYSMAVMLVFGALGYPPFFKQMSSSVLKIEFMALLAVIAGICLFVCMLIVTHDVNSLPIEATFGYSYILGWVGTGQAFITTSLIYIASKDNVYVEKIYN